MTVKIEASGFPKHLKTEDQRMEYIKESEDRYKIKLNPDNMVKNEGLRAIAKLALNSLWGRFSLRNNLSTTIFTRDPDELDNLHNDCRRDLNSVDYIDDEMETIMITYTNKVGFVDENPTSNIILSLWTTSLARLALFRQMKIVASTPNCSLLDTDTDSLVYKHPIDSDPLIECAGDHLGQLKDELPGKEIIEFVSSGSKAYAMIIED